MPHSPGGSGETVPLLRREPVIPKALAAAAAAAAADGSLAGPGKEGVDGEALASAKGLADPEPAANKGTHCCCPLLAWMAETSAGWLWRCSETSQRRPCSMCLLHEHAQNKRHAPWGFSGCLSSS